MHFISLFVVFPITVKLLEVPLLYKPMTAFLKTSYAMLGFNVAKTVKDEINNCQRLCNEIDFKFHAKNLRLMGDKKLPVLLAYSLNDHMVQNEIFNEITPPLGLKTLPEMAEAKDKGGKRHYDKWMQ